MKTHENIKRLREQLGMSQETLALKVGYKDRSSIAKVEAGLVDLTQSKIQAFADVFGVSPTELMGIPVSYDVPSRPEREEGSIEIITCPKGETEQWIIDVFRSLSEEDKNTMVSFVHYLEQQAIYKNVSENADVLPTENIA